MKNKFTSRPAPARRSLGEEGFLNPHVFVTLVVVFTGVLFTLFAGANPQHLIGERERHADRVSSTPSGKVQEAWVARYNGPGNYVDQAAAVALDDSNNVYVTGGSYGEDGLSDYATIKYDPTGQEQWVARHDGATAFGDFATAIAVDGTGVYVTGAGGGSALGQDYTTIKYNSAGEEQWIASYDGPGHSDDYAIAIVTDGSGNAYVTGASVGIGTGYDYATVKYDMTGQEQWAARYNGPANFDDQTNAIAIDDSGNVYVTGLITDQDTDFDYATIKYVQSVSPTPTPTATPTGTPGATPTPRPRPTPRH